MSEMPKLVDIHGDPAQGMRTPHEGNPTGRAGKTAREHEKGKWARRLDNLARRALENQGRIKRG